MPVYLGLLLLYLKVTCLKRVKEFDDVCGRADVDQKQLGQLIPVRVKKLYHFK